jgi:ribosomal protein S18 acetylase RimI-like enzyme
MPRAALGKDHIVDPLENPAWHALHGPQRALADGDASAIRYDPAVAPFAALPDIPTPAEWDTLAALIGGDDAILFRADRLEAHGWTERFRARCLQMVHDGRPTSGQAAVPLDVLSARDVPDMIALVERTRPGPFLTRTIELGGYRGVWDGGRLVAMAGERMRLPGYTEVSAVCVDETHRGHGFATTLINALVDGIAARREVAFLHVLTDNDRAIRRYDVLGFRTARSLDVAGFTPPSTPGSSATHQPVEQATEPASREQGIRP